MSNIIATHNETIPSDQLCPNEPNCNCRKKGKNPPKLYLLCKQITYPCNIETSESEEGVRYIGLTENSPKDRWYQHKNTSKNKEKANSTELSKYVWNLRR